MYVKKNEVECILHTINSERSLPLPRFDFLSRFLFFVMKVKIIKKLGVLTSARKNGLSNLRKKQEMEFFLAEIKSEKCFYIVAKLLCNRTESVLCDFSSVTHCLNELLSECQKSNEISITS